MRFLHTADWHLGRKIGRFDRTEEYEAILDEVVAIAKDQQVECVVVAGDLFDRAAPGLDVMRLGVEALVRLAVLGRVVVIPGNHDSSHLFEFLRPLVEPFGIDVVPRLRRPDQGGIVTVSSRAGDETISIAAFPFLHEAEVVKDFMEASEEWFKDYAQRVHGIAHALCESIDPKTIGVLAGHFFVDGSEIGGGERKIHIGPQYASSVQAIPPGIHYAALGHVHKPQEISGSPVRARYSGSLLQLDFSERSHTKEVVVVEASIGRPAKVTPIALSGGRKLLRIHGGLDSLKSRVTEFGDAYLDVRVDTDGPVMGLAHQVREFLPNALLVQAVYERSIEPPKRQEGTIAEHYGDYFASHHGSDAPAELMELVKSLEEEVVRATA